MTWGGKEVKREMGSLWGRAVSGLAPFKEPLSVSKQGRDTLVSAWWFRLYWGVVMVKHPVYQDGWCWRAVNQERNWNNRTGMGRQQNAFQLGHLLFTATKSV